MWQISKHKQLKVFSMINNIDKMDWESEFICGKWRFVDHKNRLLSFGWLDVEEMDIEKVNISTQWRINEMIENYCDFIG